MTCPPAGRRFRCVSAMSALLAMLCVLGGAGVMLAADPTVIFLEPRHLATVIGEGRVRLLVNVEDGATIDRVELRVDGERLRVLTQAPWEITWDAGDRGLGHRLEALVRLADGREGRSTIRTSPLRVNEVENVDLVNLYLVVRNGLGQYVTDLARDDFTIFEDGVPQKIERFATTHKPLRVGIALDSSRSMIRNQRLDKAKKAALEFLEILEPGDEGTVVNFNDFVHVSQEFSGDTRRLSRAIREAVPAGGTALYDAIWRSSRLLEDFDGRRVLVLLSDGKDESSSGLEPGSLHTLEEALDQALRSEVMVFPIGLGGDLDQEFVRHWDSLTGRSNVDVSTTLADVLNRLADETGGRAIMSASAGKLRKAFSEIAADLRHQYSIAYSSSNSVRNGKWREVRVESNRRSLKVVTRKGYYAPKSKRRDHALNRLDYTPPPIRARSGLSSYRYDHGIPGVHHEPAPIRPVPHPGAAHEPRPAPVRWLLSGEGNCCVPHTTPGCDNPEVEACVCALDPWCCEEFWNEWCVLEVMDYGCSEDCDSNGVPDGCEEGGIRFEIPDGSLWGEVAGCDSPPGCGHDLEAADFDGDGDLDFITNGVAGAVRWRENDDGNLRGDWHPVHDGAATFTIADVDGSGLFGSAQLVANERARAMTVADVDHDGDDDMVCRMGDDLVLFKNTGACCPWFEEPFPVWQFPPESHFWPSLVDLNSDGAPDLLVKLSPQDIGTLYNVGGPSVFGPYTMIATATGLATTDLDGDGDTDILTSIDSGVPDAPAIGWFENADGLGGFSAFAPLFTVDHLSRFVAADSDGDGDQDLIVSHWGDTDNDYCAVCQIVSVFEHGDQPLEFEGPQEIFGYDLHYATGNMLVAPFGRDFEPEILIPLRDEYDFPATDYDVYWLTNKTDDCDGNGVPDACGPDCNATGVPDACEIAAGVVTDCDGSGVPDRCETGCSTCDTDGDGCLDDLDSDPRNPLVCGDTDGDGCDDCSCGGFDPAHDGTDGDGDGICDATDCNDSLTLGWWPPSEATGLHFTQGNTTLEWQSSLDPGGTSMWYDTLRSDLATDFVGPTICVETDDGDTEATDVGSPAPGDTFFYLVRPENACPEGGTLGVDSDGLPRVGRTCP